VTPGLARRLGSMLYEALLLFAVAFFAALAFRLASGAAPLEGWLLRAHQAFLVAVFAAYFLWCWLRGGQTLAMKTWRVRLVGVTPARALLRFLGALVLVPTGVSLAWALVDRDGQFLHDRLAGTRLIRL
jgi:uncharacterized RDD family membrane protein YckC